MFKAAIGACLLTYNDNPGSVLPSSYDSYKIINPTFMTTLKEGFASGSFSIVTDRYRAEYLVGTLGHDVIITDHNGVTVWEGIIDKVSTTIGGLSIGVGPLSDVSNKVKVAYTEYDWGVSPVVPEEVETEWVYDYDSISRWGTREEYISRGQEASPGEIARVVNDIAKSKSRPKLFRDVGRSTGTRSVKLDFECIGYHHLMRKKYYSVYDGGTWGIGLAIRTVLSHIPLLSPSGIMDNGREVGKYTGEYGDPPETAYDVIMGWLSTLGSDSGYGFLFGVYTGRSVRMEELVRPTTINYYVSPRTGRLVDVMGGSLNHIPLPGEWVSVSSVHIPQYHNDLVDSAFPISSVEFGDSGEIRINETVRSALAGAVL